MGLDGKSFSFLTVGFGMYVVVDFSFSDLEMRCGVSYISGEDEGGNDTTWD